MIQLWHDGQNTSKNKIETRSDGKLGYFFIVKDCTLEKRARRTGKSPKTRALSAKSGSLSLYCPVVRYGKTKMYYYFKP